MDNIAIDKDLIEKSYRDFMEKHKDLEGITLGKDCKIETGTIPISMIKINDNFATTEQ